MNKLYVTADHPIRFVMLTDASNKLIECHPFQDDLQSQVGNIYKGIVMKKLKGIQAYFIDYGDERQGYLPFDAVEDALSPGQIVPVQVEKDAYGTKGAKLTTYLSFSGEYLVLITDSNRLMFSSKIPDDDRKKELRRCLKFYTTKETGFVVRTNSYDGDLTSIESEADYLVKHYEAFMKHLDHRPVKKCLYAQSELVRILQGINKENIASIHYDDEEAGNELVDYLSSIHRDERIECVYSKQSLFVAMDFQDQIMKLRRRKVWLSSGASLIIDRTEAMYVIDVNSDKNTSKKNSLDTIRKINEEATYEIARQIRLRNLSGIIIIDFIDAASEEDKLALIRQMISACEDDPLRPIVHGMTALSLMEMTRRRVEPSVEELLTRMVYDD